MCSFSSGIDLNFAFVEWINLKTIAEIDDNKEQKTVDLSHPLNRRTHLSLKN